MAELVRVLCVEDNRLDRELVRDALEREHGGFAVAEAASRRAFEDALARGGFDVVVSDLNILGFDGLQVLEAVRAAHPHVPVVIVTGTGSEELAVKAMQGGAADYVVKTPSHIRRLGLTILSVLEKERLKKERERALAELHGNALHLRAVLDSLGAHVAVLSPSGEIVEVNQAWLDFAKNNGALGPDAVGVGVNYLAVCRAASGPFSDEAPAFVRGIEGVMAGALEHFELEYPCHSPDEKRWFLARATRLATEEGGAVVLHVDITARKAAEELMESLWHRIAEVQETERRDIARELHDQIGQNLTALGISLNHIRADLPEETLRKVGSRLDDCAGLVADSVARVRNILGELRPPLLDLSGLGPTLDWYGERFSLRTGIAVTLSGAAAAQGLPPGVETAVFRIAQEALHNVAAHAQATRVTIALEAVPGGLRLSVSDNGVGFDPSLRGQGRRPPGWGLITMEERARGVGGRLRVDSSPGRGTTLVVEVPR